MSLRERSKWTWRRASSPVIHFDSPEGRAILPSIDKASFRVIRGRPSASLVSQPDSERFAASRPTPSLTSIPAARRRRMPLPEVRGSGSLRASTTRAGLALRSRSVHAGPRGLSCAQGSSVAYTVAPFARRPAWFSAICSACGRPPRAVAPRPTILPDGETITHPTLGLGALEPRALSPSASASFINFRSSLNPEPLLEFSILPLLFLLDGGLGGLVLLLVGDDLGVSAVRRIKLDIGWRRSRGGSEL